MINLGSFETCVCKRRGEPSDSCADQLVLQEKGKKVTLRPKSGESVKLIALDGCVFQDNLPKCDGMFVFQKGNQVYLILVELKGSDIDHAFEQVKYTREARTEYSQIKEAVSGNRSPIESAFVISNYQIDKVSQQKLENSHKVRVKKVLHSVATSPMPDLRKHL
jgi:hypothetical protein